MTVSEVVGFSDARFWLDLAQWVTTVLIGAYVWAVSRQRATTNQINTVERIATERLDRHGDRITKLESNLEHVPSGTAIEDINRRLADVHGDFQHMKGWLEGVKELLNTLQTNVAQLVENELRGGSK